MGKPAWCRTIFLLLIMTAFSAIGFIATAHAWGKEGPLLEGISQNEFNSFRAAYGYRAFGPGCMPAPYPIPACELGPADSDAYAVRGTKNYKQTRVRGRKDRR